MATKTQVEMMLKRLERSNPADFFRRIDEGQAGIGAVLRLLYESSEAVTAGRISDTLEISTARVAVLIKKMVSKGLVTKERGVIDARITIVKLTEFGAKTFEEIKNDMYQQVEIVLDTIGEERLMEFITIGEEIQSVVSPPKLNF